MNALKTKNPAPNIILSKRKTNSRKRKRRQEKIKAVENDYQTHIEALGMFKELERERRNAKKFNVRLHKIESAQINVKADRKRFQENLAKGAKRTSEIEKLKPQVKEQEELEKKCAKLCAMIWQKQLLSKNEIKSLDAKMNDLREKYITNKEQIKEAEAKAEDGKRF